MKITNWTGSAASLNVCSIKGSFKDTSWIDMLHVKARSHSTFLHRLTVSPSLMEKKNDLVCLIFTEGCPSLMKINAGLYIKKLFWQLLWGKDYKEKIKEISKTKKLLLFSLCAVLMIVLFWNMRFPLLS